MIIAVVAALFGAAIGCGVPEFAPRLPSLKHRVAAMVAIGVSVGVLLATALRGHGFEFAMGLALGAGFITWNQRRYR